MAFSDHIPAAWGGRPFRAPEPICGQYDSQKPSLRRFLGVPFRVCCVADRRSARRISFVSCGIMRSAPRVTPHWLSWYAPCT
jgi:hypothetical protein